ncbi:hypothetical protein FACS1894172_08060 [Spirochaetia bacterium]|nr:hypothetical protein FACS1894164_11490 [Spirochaetia bacterium]GHU32080.1 hypothetical protein FACS1894172_08060 [Spirochaetia bacterium]
MGNYPAALEMLQKAIAIFENPFGIATLIGVVTVPAGQIGPPTVYRNTGVVYCKMGNYPAALEMYHKALAIWEKLEHSATAGSYSNIGVVYASMGDNEKALEFSQKALAIREKVLGSEHPATVKTLQRIAELHELMGNTEEANAIQKKLGKQ